MNYTSEEKNKINDWLERVGAQTLGIDYEYEYKEGQLLAATEVFDSIYDYDRWQNLQHLIKMEIPLEIDSALEEIFWLNDIESMELKSMEEVFGETR